MNFSARYFLTRALLAAQSLDEVHEILTDKGVGAANGCSVNLTFLEQPGERIFYNIELAPGEEAASLISTVPISRNDHMIHCNT